MEDARGCVVVGRKKRKFVLLLENTDSMDDIILMNCLFGLHELLFPSYLF